VPVETLYRNIWDGQGCVAIAAQIGAIAIGATVAVCAIIGLIVWVATRKRGGGAAATIALPLAIVGVTIAGIVAYAVLGGQAINRVDVTADGMVFQGCDGLAGFHEAVAFDEIAGAAHQARRTRGRSPRVIDELVLTLRGPGEPWIIPLSTDPATMDLAVLRRLVPPQVIESWRESLAQRGISLPAGD
jgi:hypothetical protein